MDRRGFLRVLGVGGALVAAAPKLVLPPMRNVVAEPERRIFLPPSGGWPSEPSFNVGDFAIEDGKIWRYDGGRNAGYYGWPAPTWKLSIARPLVGVPIGVPQWDKPTPLAGAVGYLSEYIIETPSDDVAMLTERYTGIGRPPDPRKLRHLGKIELFMERFDARGLPRFRLA